VIASWIHSYFDNVMTKFMINNRTDTWKPDVNLSTLVLGLPRATTNHSTLAVFFNLSEAEPKPTWLGVCVFPALDARYTFPRASRWLLVYPEFWLVHCVLCVDCDWPVHTKYKTSHNKPQKKFYTCMSFNFSRLSMDESAIQKKKGSEWLNFLSMTVNSSTTKQIPSFLH